MDRHSAQRIAVIYVLFAAAWILLTSGLLLPLLGFSRGIEVFEIGKGLAFVGVTALLLYWLMLRLGHAEEARYQPLFRANPHPMWVYDAGSLRFLDVNDAAVAVYGYSRAEFLKMTVGDLLTPADRARLPEVLSSAGAGSGQIVGGWQHVRRDGTRLDVEAFSNPVPYGGRNARIVMAHDVTRQVAATAELAASEERYRALAEQAIAGVFTLEDGRFGYVNRRVADIFGYAQDGLTGLGLDQVLLPDGLAAVQAGIARMLAGEVPSLRMEAACRRKDGVEIVVGMHAAVASVGGRRVVLGMLQDISETQRAEQKIEEYAKRLERTLSGTLDVITGMIELRDPYTSGHQRQVAEIAVAIAAEMGLPEHVQTGLRVAGSVHDVGKIMVPSEILTKPGRLTPLEYLLVKEHAQQGYEVLKSVEFPWPVAEVARQHHERMDGSGYPRGLKGGEILLEARIVAIADVVESMAAHRPYRAGLGIEAALAEIEANAGRLYDPEAAQACLRIFREGRYRI